MLHIKLKGMEHRAPCKYKSVHTHTLNPWAQVKISNFFLFCNDHVDYQIKIKEEEIIIEATRLT